MQATSVTGSGGRRAARNDSLGSRTIDNVVVLGANGAMGYGSGAIFTSAVPKVVFMARTADKARGGLDSAVKLVRSSTVRDVSETATYDEFDEYVSKADLIFEAVAEDFEIKKELFERIDRVRRPDSIVATVTSGLSINALAEGRSDSFRKSFLGLHFFNPPNVIVGTELVAGKDTDPELVDFIEAFAAQRLGREMIRTADTPGFAGNRVGFQLLNEVAQLALEHGPLLMDTLMGPYTGRALTPLATVDLVGWDVHKAIVDNIYKLAPRDEARDTFALPEYMQALIDGGVLGRKTGGGFFKRSADEQKLVLDPKTRDWVAASDVKLPDLSYIDEVALLHRVGRYEDAMAAFVAAPGDEAALARKLVARYISYAFHRVGEVTETITGVDRIMAHGFNWAPPSVLVDTIGVKRVVDMMKQGGVPVPAALADADPAKKFWTEPGTNIGKYFVAG